MGETFREARQRRQAERQAQSDERRRVRARNRASRTGRDWVRMIVFAACIAISLVLLMSGPDGVVPGVIVAAVVALYFGYSR